MTVRVDLVVETLESGRVRTTETLANGTQLRTMLTWRNRDRRQAARTQPLTKCFFRAAGDEYFTKCSKLRLEQIRFNGGRI